MTSKDTGENVGRYKPLVWSSEGGGTETEAQTVILRSEVVGEEATTTFSSSSRVVGAHKVRADQLREVFWLATQQFLGLVERSQQGRIVTQESLEVGWPGVWC